MLRKMNHKNMGKSNLGWLRSIFHFSFADYYNPDNMNFGVLRVINDDLIVAHEGFGTHPHKDMEIISYVVDGELSHADSMGNLKTLYRGQVQYMSAGTGVYHSELNHGDETCRLLQIWVIPDKRGHSPNYGEFRFDWSEREDKWLHLVSDKKGDAPVKINQDINIYATYTEGEITFQVDKGRQAYLVQIEGSSDINGVDMNTRDGLEIVEEAITIKSKGKSHYLIIEMKKS